MRNKVAAIGMGVLMLTIGMFAGANIIGSANAADSTTQTTQSTKPPQDSTFDPSKGGHIGANGTKEELLTGDTADEVKKAAQKAVPGATIERVETDAEGAKYEAHMTKSDGSQVTVKLDSNFNVTSTENGIK
ncbi:MAG TPA: hypothetical protein VHE53_00735 [Patescibacteria group bacterium]|nr:hypothetical protein [Patescibacteria group bacterium]